MSDNKKAKENVSIFFDLILYKLQLKSSSRNRMGYRIILDLSSHLRFVNLLIA